MVTVIHCSDMNAYLIDDSHFSSSFPHPLPPHSKSHIHPRPLPRLKPRMHLAQKPRARLHIPDPQPIPRLPRRIPAHKFRRTNRIQEIRRRGSADAGRGERAVGPGEGARVAVGLAEEVARAGGDAAGGGGVAGGVGVVVEVELGAMLV